MKKRNQDVEKEKEIEPRTKTNNGRNLCNDLVGNKGYLQHFT